MNKCGIYLIKNVVNNRAYVGLSNDIMYRWKDHDNKLDQQKHENAFLQRDYDKCGKNAFLKEVLEECEEESLSEKEVFWGEKLKEQGVELYNIAEFGGKPPIMTSESAKKAYQTRLMAGTGISIPGKQLPEELKKKLSEKKKGHWTGDKNPLAKLSWEIVNNIRNDYKTGHFSSRQLAKKYDVDKSNILFIVQNKTWIDENYTPPEKNLKKVQKSSCDEEEHPSSKLTWELVDQIRNEYKNSKVTMKFLAEKYNLSIGYLCRIINKQVWSDKK